MAVIFDFDDLLCNSAPFHVEAKQLAFAALGHAVQSTPELEATLYGRRIPESFDILCKHYGITVDKAAWLSKRRAIFLDRVRTALEPMPGLKTITGLVERLRLPRALASSGDRAYLDVGLDRLGLGGYFPVIVSGDEVSRGKPDPEIFCLAATRLDVAPAACVVLEDSALGIAAAKRAGMRAIGVRNPHSAVSQDLSQADVVVDDLGRITEAMLKVK